MPRLTMKTLSEQLHALIDDNKLRFFLQHEQIMALRHDRDYLRESVSSLSMLAAQQAETIAVLTSKIEELAESHNRLQERELQTFNLSSSNAKRIELHGTWIRVLFNRINESAINDE